LTNSTGIYPCDQYSDGQWTIFASAVADLDADKAASLASIYRSGDPEKIAKPAANATVTRKGGRFGAAWPPADFDTLARSFDAHGFRTPCAWYLNDDANIVYAGKASNSGRLSMVRSTNGTRVCTACPVGK